MAEPPAAKGLSKGALAASPPPPPAAIATSIDDFVLKEQVRYPNGGTSLFYTCGRVALILDDGICELCEGRPVFGYSLITIKQNAYVAAHRQVFRFLREDLPQVERFIHTAEYDGTLQTKRAANREDSLSLSPRSWSVSRQPTSGLTSWVSRRCLARTGWASRSPRPWSEVSWRGRMPFAWRPTSTSATCA